MTRKTRDEFPVEVKRILAQRVNGRCSNPDCGAQTSGPTSDPARHLNIGVAAHITAAAPGGPRYNAALTEQQRKFPENGIWLCQNCGKLNDNDPDRFSADMLRGWKQAAEAHALQQIGKSSPFDQDPAPRLEVLVMSGSQMDSGANRIYSTSVAIQEIRNLFPDYFRGISRTEILGSGYGAFGHPYMILGLGTNAGWDWNVLFLTAGEFGWEMIARTTLQGQRGYVPEAVYVTGAPGALALTHVAGYGTGVFRRSTSWYRISRGEPTALISYPYQFYVAGWGMPFKRELTSTVLRTPPILTEGAALELRFEARYSIIDDLASEENGNELFSSIEMLSLEWSGNAFVPRSANDALDRIDDLWNEGTEGFVRRNLIRLQGLARTGTNRQKLFIAEHLLL